MRTDSLAQGCKAPTLFLGDGTKQVGRITSAAVSPLMGETIALGYLRREVSPGDRVRVGGADGAERVPESYAPPNARRMPVRSRRSRPRRGHG